MVGQEEKQSGGREVPLSAEAFARQDTGLIILQEAPASFGPRSTTERERTAALRQFADELFRCGVWGVLLIPALAPTLARQVVDQLARGLRPATLPTLAVLSHLTHELRRSIGQGILSSADAAANLTPEQRQSLASELAWEVTLFARNAPYAALVEQPTKPVAAQTRAAA
jgi:hypothetical protein